MLLFWKVPGSAASLAAGVCLKMEQKKKKHPFNVGEQ